MWGDFKSTIHRIIEERVPTKLTQARLSIPWMNTKIRRLIKRKQRAHKKARRTGLKRDKDRYKRLQQEAQWETRRAHRQYMQEVSSEYTESPKRFWSYIKSLGQELVGIPFLKNSDGFMKRDTQNKADILNEQFKSAVTIEDKSSTPDKGPSPYQTMPNIKISCQGVAKLLKGLKPHKATGPDSILTRILKSAATELAPILTQIYQFSLDAGDVPQNWRDAWTVPEGWEA